MDLICKNDECDRTLAYSGKGRPPSYCPEHATTARKATWAARPKGGHRERPNVSQCCLDARTAGVERYGVERDVKVWQINRERYATSAFTCEIVTVHGAHVRPAKVSKCAQHKEDKCTWLFVPSKSFAPDTGKGDNLSRIKDPDRLEDQFRLAGGFRFTTRESISFMIPESRLITFPESGTKHGVDRELEREANRWLAKWDTWDAEDIDMDIAVLLYCARESTTNRGGNIASLVLWS